VQQSPAQTESIVVYSAVKQGARSSDFGRIYIIMGTMQRRLTCLYTSVPYTDDNLITGRSPYTLVRPAPDGEADTAAPEAVDIHEHDPATTTDADGDGTANGPPG